MSTATAKLIETHRDGAEVYYGDICNEKVPNLMEEFSLPKGLFPVEGLIEEFGWNSTTGFFWVRMKKKKEHKFKSIGQTVIYGPEITGFVKKGHLSKLKGVKAKELLIPVVVCDILVGDPSPDMIKFTTPVGLSRPHPASAFQLEDGGK